ncbi:hypothetical protein NC653_022655 [Populus alba x Populus x berolinensis]|uniref:Uncharacterized protein n=1 Tax=Populus alba x Populus x berolinensis TaxID=444605 RepID=A0AAD6MGP5_9ROSI|nr:hypothetical protein NC653_022655 [Populus alba x Populus x berolinensis]
MKIGRAAKEKPVGERRRRRDDALLSLAFAQREGEGDGEGEEACKLIVILYCLESELNWENMAKRELSSTLKNLKFMQRAVQREEKTKKQGEEVKPDGNFFSLVPLRSVMEGDPHPGAVLGRMSFQSFNPSVDKLNEAAANEASDARASTSSHQSGRTSFRENESSPDGVECSNTAKPSSEVNGDHKRKQSEVASEIQHQNKSPKMVQDGHQSSPNSSKGSFKQPKRGKLDWNVLRPKSQHNQNKRGCNWISRTTVIHVHFLHSLNKYGGTTKGKNCGRPKSEGLNLFSALISMYPIPK